MDNSNILFERAKKVIPGGVNSPVRAFKAVGGSPRFISRAKGSKIYDADNNEYIDYIGSWGPMILGHANDEVLDCVEKAIRDGLSFGAATQLEVEMAELITQNVKPIEMVRMVSSGTEAVMSAIRLARGFTGKEKIIKFAGCYHGHCDSMLVKAGSGALANGYPDSGGVTKGSAMDTLIAEYNNLSSVEELLCNNHGEVAAIIVEPVAANMGVITPNEGFLQGLRHLCDKYCTLLIFDEVITGFRLCFGGAMEYFNVTADLVTYGKIIGGGMPVGAYGGRREIMEHIAPLGNVYQAGTLSGNPIAMTAGLKTLNILKNTPSIYKNINYMTEQLTLSLRSIPSVTVNSIGSLVCPFFYIGDVYDYETAKKSDVKKYAGYFNHMLNNGIYIAPAQFEAMFISNSHTQTDIDTTIQVVKKYSYNLQT